MGISTTFPLTTSEIASAAKQIHLDLVKPMNSYDWEPPNLDDWEIDESDSNDW